MKRNYYKVPFDFKSFFEHKDLEKISLKDSIAQYISMVITTAYKEYKHNAEFGSEIWESDFDVLSNINSLKEKIKLSLIEKIGLFEKRLNNPKIVVVLGETYIPDVNQTRLKKQLVIKISGNLKKTNESFSFVGRYFIAPLSYQEY
jgi:phage baseplate assembly protein W